MAQMVALELANSVIISYGSATKHLKLSIWVDCWVSTQALCLNDQAYSCLIHLRDNSVTLSVLEDDLWWKTTFDGGRPPEKMFMIPHLDSHSTNDPKPEILSAV